MALQRLKLIAIEGEKSETTEFASYKAIADYASAKMDGSLVSTEKTPPVESHTGEPEDKKFLQNELQEQVQERTLVLSETEGDELGKEVEPVQEAPAEPQSEPETEKKFLQNDLKKQIQAKKANTQKKSFWDKLK